MTTEALIPFVAFVAYIPLLGVLLANRPWQERQRLLLLYLIPATLWSLSDVLFRGNFLGDSARTEFMLLEVVLCTGIWMGAGFYCFFSSFYQTRVRRAFLAYLWLAAAVVAASLGGLGKSGPKVEYNLPVLLPLAISLTVLFSKGIYSLVQRFRHSSDAAERNQIAYLFIAMAVLAVFGFVSFSPSLRHLPLAHIGNLAMACILTYGVVTHRLVDIKVVARRVVIYVILYGSGIGILLLLVGFVGNFGGRDISPNAVMAIIGLGTPAVLLFVQRLRDFWQTKVDRAFVGESYSYRRQLSEFVAKIHSLPTLEQSGSGLISLLSQSIGCLRACLLLPKADDGGLSGTSFV